MPEKIVPMIHVPDVKTTADWYNSIGFKTLDLGRENGGEIVWGLLALGDSRIMLSAGGKPSTAHRREVDLYIHTDDVEHRYQGLKDRVQVVEGPHDMFYGMREFILRDYNGFWITFGQPIQTKADTK
jgi:uncharacterized glyoxalase superfamily protein PhnB